MDDGEGRGDRLPRAAKQGALNAMHMSQQSTPGRSMEARAGTQQHDDVESVVSDLDSISVSGTPMARGRKRRGDDGHDGPGKRGRGGRGGGRGGGRTIPNEHEDESSLWAIICNGRVAHRAVIDEWMEDYDRNADSAMVKLDQLFIDASGCRGVITELMIQTMDIKDVIRRMTEEFDEDSGDYPFAMAGPMWRKRRQHLGEFVGHLIDKCKSGVLFDSKMMDGIVQLLVGLADSQVRAFRHTATFAAMKVMTAVVEVTRELIEQRDQNNRQLDVEKAKQHNKRAGNERLEFLIKKKNEIDEKFDELTEMLTFTFRSVFVHRYRDIVWDIRSICIEEVGTWIKILPEFFLEDSYLKYIGWTLNDKVPEVRLCCLNALAPLFEDEAASTKLELFINKFKDRLVSMSLDRDVNVAVHAVRLVTAVYRMFPSLIVMRDSEQLFDIVYHQHRGLAVAAADFVNVKLFSADKLEGLEPPPSKKGKRSSPNAPLIRDLVQFFEESQMHKHAAYLVDALIDTNSMVKDFEAMTDLLLDESVQGNEPLGDKQEGMLIEIMVCAVKQAATGEPPVGRSGSQKKQILTAKEQRVLRDDKTRLTEHFIQTLPLLLQKYGADSEKLENLLQIPQHLDLDMYAEARQEKHLDALLRRIEEIVDKHGETEVLKLISTILETLCSEPATEQPCTMACSKIIDAAVLKMKHDTQRFLNEESIDEEDEAALLISFRKVSAFYRHHDLSKYDLWESLIAIVAPPEDEKVAATEVRSLAIGSLFSHLIWDAERLIRDGEPDRPACIERTKTRINTILTLARDELLLDASFCEVTFSMLCDLLHIYGWRMAERFKDLEQLAITPDKVIVGRLVGFVTDNVFVHYDLDETEQSASIENSFKRRIYLGNFCKLIIYGIISIQSAACVLKFYLQFYTDFGDILKHLLAKCRELNKVQCAKAVASALIMAYNDITEGEDEEIDVGSQEFNSIKELARRFGTTFGSDLMKNRDAIAMLHRECIVHSLGDGIEKGEDAPRDLPFLEVAMEFSGKLHRQDKNCVLSYLDKRLARGLSTEGEEWQPLLLYRNSLVAADEHNTQPARQANTRGRGRGRGRPPNTPAMSEQNDD